MIWKEKYGHERIFVPKKPKIRHSFHLDHMKFDMVAEPGSSKDHQKPGSGLRKEQKPVQCNWNSKSDKRFQSRRIDKDSETKGKL